MKKVIIFIALFFTSFHAFSQGSHTKYLVPTGRVTVHLHDSVAEFGTAKRVKKRWIKYHKTYTWYKQNEVHYTQGSHDGKLLNGKFVLFGSKHDLLQKGNYRRGLKIGKWLYWNEKGTLDSAVMYSNGNRKRTLYPKEKKPFFLAKLFKKKDKDKSKEKIAASKDKNKKDKKLKEKTKEQEKEAKESKKPSTTKNLKEKPKNETKKAIEKPKEKVETQQPNVLPPSFVVPNPEARPENRISRDTIPVPLPPQKTE